MNRPQYLALCVIGGLAFAALIRTFEIERKINTVATFSKPATYSA